MTFSHALSTNNYGPAKFIVDASAANGTHITIATALTSSTSGDTIFIRPGTYTENLTLKAGVNLTAFGSDSSLNGTGKVIISGTCTFTSAGSVTISGIQLQTNSAALLAVTGSAASVVNLENCYLNCTNNTGITFSAASASARINMKNCSGNIGTTGISLLAQSSTGTCNIYYTSIFNSGSSLTASTVSEGSLIVFNSAFNINFTSSSTGGMGFFFTYVDVAAFNITATTFGGSGSSGITNSFIASGTAVAASIGASGVVSIINSTVSSSNASAIDGAGSLANNNITFPFSQKISTTTQTGGISKGGQTQAPSAGFIGEQLTASATAVATTSTTAKTITSVSLTAGIWDISGSWVSSATGGTTLMQATLAGISVTNNTLPANPGIDYTQLNIVAAVLGGVVPLTRVTLTATTTYYLVVNNFYTSTTCPSNAKITATRVG